MTTAKPKILVYGFGNPGRQDDGLGVSFAEAMQQWAISEGIHELATETNYQLNLEDASTISAFDVVVFADASEADVPDFRLELLEPSARTEFSMHAVSPAFILHLCKDIFNKSPEAWLLHIKGYKWNFLAEPTNEAAGNLAGALTHMKDFIAKRRQ